MPSPALEVHGLVKRYGALAAVDGLDLLVPPATVTAVLGRNGAGKTTTVEVCAGLLRADAGEVRVLGLDPAREPRALRARVGVMPQAAGSGVAGVYPATTPREVLDLFAALYAHPLPPAALVERLDLGRVLGTPWRRLSGGEQQRLSLALAVIGRPELVFLDEPTAGLDLHGRRATWDLVTELRTAGVTVVLTTHQLDEAERLADEIVIVERGRIAAAGSPADLTAGGRTLEDLFLSLTGAASPA